MKKVIACVEQLVLPTYAEPAAEEFPMFAENRVHQRSTGRPYPNKVVLQVDRTHRKERAYTVVRLENEYIRVVILPEIGGRIYSATDKTTGYDFFYKQHVIKPALIGALGSWVSGGVEFNWPFHHRASGFMPCDFHVEELEDGSAICWLSEHDPIDRMKGMVGIVLRPGESSFETRMRLYNRTSVPHSFLWWENAAVPVNEQYQIFFPQDVTYVNFHYLKSRCTYPLTNKGVFNGITMPEGLDISWHKNTRQATSYFASASQYDFFGGYDHGKECGVVHIGDHHVSPGKKMFTWAYSQLATSWENALTDTDGQYAELMAGSYSDNQPNFAWLEPYETKQFSQHWYPISKVGTPVFANLNCAFSLTRTENGATLRVQSTKCYKQATIQISAQGQTLYSWECELMPAECISLTTDQLPEFVTITVLCDGNPIASYTEQIYDQYNMPETITDMPSAAAMNSVEELYLAGVHVDQYRDPAILPDAYWKEALKRDIYHVPSLIAMAEYEYKRYNLEEALYYINRAIERQTIYNARPQSGKLYYVQGQILEAMGQLNPAYDAYAKAAWAADSVGRAMTRMAMIDVHRGDYSEAIRHADTALMYGSENLTAAAAKVIALRKSAGYFALTVSVQNDVCAKQKAHLLVQANELLNLGLSKDPLNHMLRFLAGAEDLYDIMDSNAAQTCLDLTDDLAAMGQYDAILSLLTNLCEKKPDQATTLVYYALGYYTQQMNGNGMETAFWYGKAKAATLGSTFPFRHSELLMLTNAMSTGKDTNAALLLGNLYYSKFHYEKAASLWQQAGETCQALRNLAIAYFSHLNRHDEALSLMKRALEMQPADEELLYETVVLMDKLRIDPTEKIALLESHTFTRDDIQTELAKAYNQTFQPDKALDALMSHSFVPCEGGEHAIADQYMFAYFVKGRNALEAKDYETALGFFREGQVLPQILGAGIWNHCKLIGNRYGEALCLEALGETAKAQAIFRYIADTPIDYFTNMHLKELPYYQAKALNHLGEPIEARQIITRFLRECTKLRNTKDNTFFGTTPFFISFIDEPKRMREALYQYLWSLCADHMGKVQDAAIAVKESSSLNNDNLFALSFEMQGFFE